MIIPSCSELILSIKVTKPDDVMKIIRSLPSITGEKIIVYSPKNLEFTYPNADFIENKAAIEEVNIDDIELRKNQIGVDLSKIKNIDIRYTWELDIKRARSNPYFLSSYSLAPIFLYNPNTGSLIRIMYDLSLIHI